MDERLWNAEVVRVVDQADLLGEDVEVGENLRGRNIERKDAGFLVTSSAADAVAARRMSAEPWGYSSPTRSPMLPLVSSGSFE